MASGGDQRAFAAAVLAAALTASPVFAQPVAEQPAPPSPLQLYEQRLDQGDWVTGQTLAIEDVAYSFEMHVNGRDDRESAVISTWHGVSQSGGAATVMFQITGMDVVFSDHFTEEQSAICRHLNDGRWWCEAKITSLKINEGFYLERRPLGEAEPAAGGAPTSAPPR